MASYSFSKLSEYTMCPFKFKHGRKYGSDNQFTITGKICHETIEGISLYVSRENTRNKLISYMSERSVDVDVEEAMSNGSKIDPSIKDGSLFQLDRFLSTRISHFEPVSMPSREVCEKYFGTAIVHNQCLDEDIIEDCRFIMNSYYKWKDFSVCVDDLMLAEKKLAFDTSWKVTGFFDPDVFFRGVIDNIVYSGRTIIITDYKTSRNMLDESGIKESWQLKTYVLFIYKMIPRESYDNIVVRFEYLRHRVAVEAMITDVETVIESALVWINETVAMIESDSEFKPKRNENCGYCNLRTDGLCPLFNRLEQGVGSPTFVVTDRLTCASAWKEVERLDAEREAIISQCKSFIKGTDDVVVVDDVAKLSFHPSESKDVDSVKVAEILEGLGIDLKAIMKRCTISATNVGKIAKDLKVDPLVFSDAIGVKIKKTFCAKVD